MTRPWAFTTDLGVAHSTCNFEFTQDIAINTQIASPTAAADVGVFLEGIYNLYGHPLLQAASLGSSNQLLAIQSTSTPKAVISPPTVSRTSPSEPSAGPASTSRPGTWAATPTT